MEVFAGDVIAGDAPLSFFSSVGTSLRRHQSSSAPVFVGISDNRSTLPPGRWRYR
jgi:hypothetical protein